MEQPNQGSDVRPVVLASVSSPGGRIHVEFGIGNEIHCCGVPVISVGNLTTGGTGKTPIVCFLAKWFRGKGLRVAIVSRGYGRGDQDSNDEAMELDARLPDVPHVQDPDRVEAARVAVEELEAQVILMDDGFQHRRLHRDLNVVVIDATCPFGYGFVLPRGLLREPIAGLQRADLVVITRCHAVAESEINHIERTIEATHAGIPVVRSHHQPTQLLEYPETGIPIETINHEVVGVLSAIGNPDAFEQTVRECGSEVVDASRLPDHDCYSPETVGRLQQWARNLDPSVNWVVCTHKDLVKLQTDRLGGKRLAALQIELAIASGSDSLAEKLEQIAGQAEAESNDWDA